MNHWESAVHSLQQDWAENLRWQGVRRDYLAEDVVRLRGSVVIDYTLARRGADKLWQLLQQSIRCKQALAMQQTQTGQQATQQIREGAQALYLSACQVAAPHDGLVSAAQEESQGLRCINRALLRADQLQWMAHQGVQCQTQVDFMVPVIVEASSRSGGGLSAFDQMSSMIDAGVSGLLLGDRLIEPDNLHPADATLLMSTSQVINQLTAARLAADVAGVPTLLMLRTSAGHAALTSSNEDVFDQPFLSGSPCAQGHFGVRSGLEYCIQRALAYAPYADVVCCESVEPDLQFAQQFAAAVKDVFPGKRLAYDCASMHQKNSLDEKTRARLARQLSAMGYQMLWLARAGSQGAASVSAQWRIDAVRHRRSAFAVFQQKQLPTREPVIAEPRPQVRVGYFDVVRKTLAAAQSTSKTGMSKPQKTEAECVA